jgi:hypothetical protein
MGCEPERASPSIIVPLTNPELSLAPKQSVSSAAFGAECVQKIPEGLDACRDTSTFEQ